MITNRDELINALANNSQTVLFEKSSIANATAGLMFSTWLALGSPLDGNVPITPEACNSSTQGALSFPAASNPEETYLAWMSEQTVNALTTTELHDRLAHMGGLSGTSLAEQTVDLDIADFYGANNMEARVGASDLSELCWWLEWYNNTGGSSAVVDIGVTLADNSSLEITVQWPSNRRRSYMMPLHTVSGLGRIRRVDYVGLRSSTGTVGDFGITVTRCLTALVTEQSNLPKVMDWSQLGLPKIEQFACLFFAVVAGTTSTGVIKGNCKFVRG